MKYLITFLIVLVVVVAGSQIYKGYDNPLLLCPAGAAPAQDSYFQALPQAPEYYALPPGYPPEYYHAPQLYFYHEPCAPYFRPGVSIFIGAGWWYTPGCGMINIGRYHPTQRPFPSARGPHSSVVVVGRNISTNSIHININRAGTMPHRPPHRF